MVSTVSSRSLAAALWLAASPSWSHAGSKAQAAIERGVSALHDYWFEKARLEFEEALRADPDCVLAYWGEAKSHYLPLWLGHDGNAIAAVLARIPDRLRARADDRERRYLDAVAHLAGTDDVPGRKKRYAEAMEALARDYPDDIEARAFWIEAMFGTLDLPRADMEVRERAAAVARGILQENPSHPGALHYLMHALDHPRFAWRAIDEARRYSALAAPQSSHAIHMPTHIYLQLGLWADVVSENERAFEASRTWIASRGVGNDHLDFHTIDFLVYGQLQEGSLDEAERTLAEVRRMARDTGERAHWLWDYIADKEALILVESEAWQQGALGDPAAKSLHAVFAGGLNAYWMREGEALHALARALRSRSGSEPRARIAFVMLDGLERLLEGETEQGIERLRLAVGLEAKLSAWESPEPMKPPAELLGEVLLALGRPAEAKGFFEASLARRPARRLTLRGLDRARKEMGR